MKGWRVLLLLLPMLLAACIPNSPTQENIQTPNVPAGTTTEESITTETAVADIETTPEETSVSVVETPTGDPNWTVVRDDTYGFGVAIPCWWQVTPIPGPGVAGSMTIASYDEAYFLANSEKGWWIGGEIPPGAIKADITVLTGINPDHNTADAVRILMNNDTQKVETTEEQAIGNNLATVAKIKVLNGPGEDSVIPFFRLAPDKLLFVAVAPQIAWDSPDIMGILESITITPEGEVPIPAYPPSPAIIDVPPSCHP